ncbi:PTS lactose/cellobiose IIA subunit [Mesoplasma florum]|uniref:PTS lactose/cellobiose transporter subunit IIA n=1 Tax=Mesoplasma florum TaxID=2151 RepID=UPI000D0260FF|nr:PTS lactose/cellobiose transporter subunit IIA [Mesoplasma florum]AVN63660.1 PTS lactose/cellobiose IIA subunit [Mesoplasma florum]
MTKELNWEEISFTIIAYAGEAKTHAIESIRLAKEGKFDETSNLLEKAEESLIVAEKAHMDVIVKEAQGEQLPFKVLFLHAEDQLLTTQTIVLLAKEFVDLYKRIGK